jgi:hypothetical protein
VEARDLVDVQTALERYPELLPLVRRRMAEPDAGILQERLLAWTEASLRRELAAYPAGCLAAAQSARALRLQLG